MITASLIEALLMLYSCSLVSFRPLFTMLAYTCSPSSMGSHMPSSAKLRNAKTKNRNAIKIFFIRKIFLNDKPTCFTQNEQRKQRGKALNFMFAVFVVHFVRKNLFFIQCFP